MVAALQPGMPDSTMIFFGARVLPMQPGEEAATLTYSVTNNSGNFEFASVPSGRYLVRAKAEDMHASETEVTVADFGAFVKVQLKVLVEEQVQVSATEPDPLSPDRNADAIDLNDTLLRNLPTDSQNIIPLISSCARYSPRSLPRGAGAGPSTCSEPSWSRNRPATPAASSIAAA